MKKGKQEKLIHDFIQETSYTQMETKYCIMGSINQDKQWKWKLYITFHISYKYSTYQIIMDPSNGK